MMKLRKYMYKEDRYMCHKRWLCWVLCILCLLCFGCKKTDVPETVPEVTYLTAVEKPVPVRDAPAALAEQAVSADTQEALDIAYYQWASLIHPNGSFYIGVDQAYYRMAYNTRPGLKDIMERYPTAIRQRDDRTYYFAYGSDKGYYVYLFFSKDNGNEEVDGIYTPVGFPIVIKEELSYADFKGIAPGDGIDAVAEIDPVAQMYEQRFLEDFTWNTYAANHKRENNDPIATVHYLTDGLMKIEYDIVDDTQLVVENILFSETYDLTNLYGETYNYSILPQDLPF